MAEEPTKETVERAKQFAEALAAAGANAAELAENSTEYSNKLEEAYGNQLRFATEQEKMLVAAEKVVEGAQEHIQLLAEKARLERQNYDDMSTANKARLDELKEITEKLKEGSETTQQTIARMKQEAVLQKEKRDELKKISTIQNETSSIIENNLQQTLGLKNATGDLADAMIDALEAGEGFGAVLEGAAKAYRKTFTKANLMKGAKNMFVDVAKKGFEATFSAQGVRMEFMQLDRQFAQSTGLSQELGGEIKSLSQNMVDQHFTMAETSRAFETLATQSKAFTDLGTAQRTMLTEQALQFSRIGVSADTFANTIDSLGKTFGATPEEINKTTEEMAKFGQALGVGPNQMLEDFNKQLPLLARYGEKEGAAMFRELATTAKQAGVEMEDLVGIAKTFDTFESAAEAAGKLNFVLGGPLLNSVQLMNANEADRIQMLKDSMAASGKSFAQMDRFEKELVAKTLNTSADVAQKLFSDENISSIEEATAAVENKAAGMGDLADQAANATTLEQKQAAARERGIKSMEEMNGTLMKFHEFMVQIKGILAEYGPVLALVHMGFKAIGVAMAIAGNKGVLAAVKTGAAWMLNVLGAIVLVTAAVIALGVWMLYEAIKWVAQSLIKAIAWAAPWLGMFALVLAALAVLTLAFLMTPIGMIILAIGATITAVVVYWDELVAGFTAGIDWVSEKFSVMAEYLPELFNKMLDGLKSVLKGFLKIVSYAVEGFLQYMFLPLSALVEGAAKILEYIPGMGGVAGALKSFSPMRIIHSYAGQMRGAIDAFEGGVTNYTPGEGEGMSLVGEAGPELVTLPRGSNVVTNENVNRLMGEGKAGPAAATPKDQVFNITLKLDSDVLARHTRKVAFDTITKTMEFNT